VTTKLLVRETLVALSVGDKVLMVGAVESEVLLVTDWLEKLSASSLSASLILLVPGFAYETVTVSLPITAELSVRVTTLPDIDTELTVTDTPFTFTVNAEVAGAVVFNDSS
jgi:hypothetical protein